MSKYKTKLVTRKKYLVAPIAIRNRLLKAGIDVGRYCASKRVSGWGNFYGKVEVTEHEISDDLVKRDKYRVEYLKTVCVQIEFPNGGESELTNVLAELEDYEIDTEEQSYGTRLIVRRKK